MSRPVVVVALLMLAALAVAQDPRQWAEGEIKRLSQLAQGLSAQRDSARDQIAQRQAVVRTLDQQIREVSGALDFALSAATQLAKPTVTTTPTPAATATGPRA